MIIGITALVLVASILLFRQLSKPSSHKTMWSNVLSFFNSQPLSTGGKPKITINAEKQSTSPFSEEFVVEKGVDTRTNVTVRAQEAPQLIFDGEPTNDQIPPVQTPKIPQVMLNHDDSDNDDDDDAVPAFPALNSAQRASGGIASLPSHSRSTPQSFPGSMLPPPIPIRNRNALANSRMGLSPSSDVRLSSPNSSLSSTSSTPTQDSFLKPRLPASSALSPPKSASLALPPTHTTKLQKPRKKVILEPGHSPLDWARLQQSGKDLRGVPFSHLIKVTPSELKKHNKVTDCWMALEDRVYNATPYLAFHPGGEKEMMRVAGRDGTKLYMKTHSWVNYDNMLKGCLIGMLVPEVETEQVSVASLDSMD